MSRVYLFTLFILYSVACTAPRPVRASPVDDQRQLVLSVVDADSQQSLPARVYLTDEDGRHYFFKSLSPEGSAVTYEKQNWINAKSIEYHTTLSPHPASATLPAGSYTLEVVHGPSYLPQTRRVTMDHSDKEVTVALKRWANPMGRGWYSGDTHLHRTIDELKNILPAEDLNVALPLTYWVTKSHTAPTSGDRNQEQIPRSLIQIDASHVIWPRNTEYEIFTVGPQQHTLGALFLLGHHEPLATVVPPWEPVIREAGRNENGTVLYDMDKLDWPFAMVLPTMTPGALYELTNNHVWRTEFAFSEWNSYAPPFLRPPFGGNQGGHRQWIDYTLGMYYTLLNCGLKLPPSAGTANGVHPVPAGFGRVYVNLPDGFTYDAWMKGLGEGRSFVSTGPLLYAKAANQDPGYTFKWSKNDQTELEIEIEVQSQQPLGYGEIIVNGRPELLLRPQNEPLPQGGYRSQISTTVTPQHSGWFCVRFWEPQEDGQTRFAHTAPWYVSVNDEPTRISRAEKQYLLGRMRTEIERSRDVVATEALAEYERAFQFYSELPEVDDRADVARVARASRGPALEHWLDNMIIEHRFSAEEIRLATGLKIEEALAAIDARRDQPSRVGNGEVVMLPYPGGRHPRTGFLDGAIDPQRDTKLSLFAPWQDGGYVVVDVPEAIFSNLGLTYLAHTHIPTIWDKTQQSLEPLEWSGDADQLSFERRLPNGIRFSARVTRESDGALMQLQLANGTSETLTDLRVQVCDMLRGLTGFSTQDPRTHIIDGPMIAIRADDADRWLVTGWLPNNRVWMNPPVPCVHSDPIFPDCPAGETVACYGGVWFVEAADPREAMADYAARLKELQVK